jgi:hypothetical protein
MSDKEKFEIARETYKDARESLTSIQLRLNPEHVKKRPKSPEAILWDAISRARADFAADRLDETEVDCDKIRDAAAPLLKQEWERVKKGEMIFRVVRVISLVLVSFGIGFVVFGAKHLVQ